MPKTYSYLFSYYWKVTWNDENSFKNDTANYKGFKQRIKRECKVTLSDSVSLYLNLRWVTTLGRMQTLFPNAHLIEVSSPEEFGTMKDAKEIKPIINRKTYKLRRAIDPTEKYSYSLRELPSTHKTDRRINNNKVRIPIKLLKPKKNSSSLSQHSEHLNRKQMIAKKKKVHNELEDKGTVSTEYSSYSPKKPLDEDISPEKNAPILEEIEDQSPEKDEIIGLKGINDIENDFGLAPERVDEFEWNKDKQDEWGMEPTMDVRFYQKRFKDVGIENSIDNYPWDINNPKIDDFDLA